MNSTAAVLIIITLLTYGTVCIKRKMELLSAVALSFAVLLAGFGIFGGILWLCGSFSPNKTLAILIAASLAMALFCRLSGEKPKVMLKAENGCINPFLRDFAVICMALGVYIILEYFVNQEDYVFIASKGFYDYLWLLAGTALAVLCFTDICVHTTGYIKTEKKIQYIYCVLSVAIPVVLAVTALVFAAKNSGPHGFLIVLFLVMSVFAAGVGLAMLYGNRDFVELSFLAVSEMVLAYLLSSGILIGLNIFSVMRAAFFTSVLTILLCIVIYFIKRTKPQVVFQWKKNLCGLAFCIILLPLSASVFGMYGMGQDEGVYQAKAIGYLYGFNNNYVSFEEYEECFGQDKDNYMSVINDCLVGYNFTLSEENVRGVLENDTVGSLHGIHTFSALLAAYATVSGVENMLSLGTWILILSVFLLWLILGNLKIKTIYKAAAMFLYILSPQIIWQAKTSLVETTLAFIILSMLYLLTDKKHEQYRWLFFIPIIVFSFFHITIYVFMPLFVLMAYGMYFTSAKRRYIAAAILSILGYLAGFYMMYASSLLYVYGNYDRLYIGPVETSNLKEFITLVSVAGVIISAILCMIPVKSVRKKRAECEKSKKGSKCKKIIWAVFVWTMMTAGVAACFAAAAKSEYPVSYMTWYAYILSSGFILFAAIAAAVLAKPSWFRENDSIVLLSVMFYYCIIIYSSFFKKEVLHYYYYGRYIVPYVSVIVIMGAYMLNRFSYTAKKHRVLSDLFPVVCTVTVLAVASVILPYTSVPVTQQDQTQLQWDILTDVASLTENENSAVLIEEELIPQMMLSLKYMTGSDVYPLREDTQDLKIQCAVLKEKYNHVYIVGAQQERYDSVYMEEIYHKDNKIQMDVKMPEELDGIAAWIPYAEEFVSSMQPILVYEYQSEP